MNSSSPDDFWGKFFCIVGQSQQNTDTCQERLAILPYLLVKIMLVVASRLVLYFNTGNMRELRIFEHIAIDKHEKAQDVPF